MGLNNNAAMSEYRVEELDIKPCYSFNDFSNLAFLPKNFDKDTVKNWLIESDLVSFLDENNDIFAQIRNVAYKGECEKNMVVYAAFLRLAKENLHIFQYIDSLYEEQNAK